MMRTACVPGSIGRRDRLSERRRGATGWPCSQGLLVAMLLLAPLIYLSGCGSGQTGSGQANSVPVSLSISMPQKSPSTASASTIGSRLWATIQSWLPTVTSAWAATADLSTLTVAVTGPGIPSPITMTIQLPANPPPFSGQVIEFGLDVPVGPERVFTVSGLDAFSATILQGESSPTTLTAGQAATVAIQLLPTITILVETIPPITTPSLPNGTVGFTYLTSSGGTVTLSASGGTPPYTWSILPAGSPSEPAPGLSLCPSGVCPNGEGTTAAGQITGIPTDAGTFTRTYRVQDSNGAAGTTPLTITVNTQLTIDTTTLTDGTVAQIYSATVAASGGAPPYTWSIVCPTTCDGPTLPAPGLSLSPSGATAGQITGVPTTAGTFPQTYHVQDSSGAAVTKDLTLSVNPPMTITTTALPDGTVDFTYLTSLGGTVTLSASGGAPKYTWSIVGGSLPDGLKLSSDGQITGIPTVCNDLASFTQTYRVQDTNGAVDTKDLSFFVFCSVPG